MKQPERSAEDERANEVLHEMKAEIHEETRADRRDKIVREFIEHAHDKTSAAPEEIQFLVEAILEQRPHEFPSLLDMHGGDTQWAAAKVVDHMINAAMNGDTMLIQRAMGDLESLAADIIHTPSKLWLPNG